MVDFPTPPGNHRIGFHYFPDTLHYRDVDLATWLPELISLGASWLTLMAPPDRAIPENFLNGLITAGIEPVLHFHLPAAMIGSQVRDLRLLFEAYARWGVHYVALFDRPNLRAAWPGPAWSQRDLVERFLDGFLSFFEMAIQAGLFPVFAPLEPGGDYWDTAFLRLALQGLQRRSRSAWLEKLVLGAYAWTWGRPLGWGAGGPERWPGAKPYESAPGSQDQLGFRIFDWYLALARSVFHENCPLLILGGGSRISDSSTGSGEQRSQVQVQHARLNLAVASLMAPIQGPPADGRDPEPVFDPLNGDVLEVVPANVLACNFWLLAAAPDSPYSSDAWYQAGGETLPAVNSFRQRKLRADNRPPLPDSQVLTEEPPFNYEHINPALQPAESPHKPIDHYLLLPSYEWGVSDWHLDIIRPFVKKYHPAVGYSMEEALLAQRVTVVGGVESFPVECLVRLRQSGCIVQQICGDGTDIATQLSRM